MSQLLIYGEPAETVFDLLGVKENSITYAIGWTFSKSDSLLKSFLKEFLNQDEVDLKDCIISLQEYDESDNGFTDIEITILGKASIIIEAKRGWNLPIKAQICKYEHRLEGYDNWDVMLITLSECNESYSDNIIKSDQFSIPIINMSYSRLIRIAETAKRNSCGREKHLINELLRYLRKVMSMRDIRSNLVYVVSLAHGKPEWSSINWIDIIIKNSKYFYPVAKNWPPNPPNYIGFRYDGKLQSIHHVENYEVVDDLNSSIPEITKGAIIDPHYVLDLGPGFKPNHEVITGAKWRSNRVWCMLDTLLTCDTIEEARNITKLRTEKVDDSIIGD
jgi:hypothetical protein